MNRSAVYRAFVLNRHGGVHRAEVVAAFDDAEAIRLVRSIDNDYGIELWDRERIVARATPTVVPTETGTGG